MKQGWEIKKLGEVCKISPPKSEVKSMNLKDETLVSFLPMEDLGINQMYIHPHNSRSLSEVSGGYTYFAENDILLAKVTPCFENGKLGIARGLCSHIGFGSSEYIVIRADESNVTSEYIYYGLMTNAFRENGARLMLGASGLKRLPKDYVANYELGIPSKLSEQERIVGILDSAFAKIEALRANAQQNLQNTKDLFQASLKQELTPKQGWETQKLDAIADITSSKRIYKNEYVREGIPFYRTKEIKELANGHEISLELFISTERYQEIKNKFGVPQIGDILISAVGTIGEILVIRDKSEFYFKDGNIIWIKDVSKTTSSFLSYKLKSIIEQLKSITIGAAYSALTIEKFKEMEVSFPDSKIEQQAIVKKLDELSERCRAMEENYRQTIAHCNALKQALLTKAFNGEL